MRTWERTRQARRRLGLLVLPLVGALALAGTPAGASAADPHVSVYWMSSDVVPSRTPAVRTTAEVEVVAGLNLSDHPGPATFVLRDARGARVHVRTVEASCLPAVECFPGDDQPSAYTWRWDGRRPDGRLLPAGRYVLSVTLPDGAGGTLTREVGPTWIRHLVSVQRVRTWTPAAQASYSRVGRCSAIATPGRWPGSVGLRSLTRCRSTAGTNDLAAQTFRMVLDGTMVERVAAWRLDAYGAPARSGMTASLWGLGARGWQRSAVLGNGLRWHHGTTRRTALDARWLGTGEARRLVVHAQARAAGGSRYDVKLLRTVLTYRSWVR